MSDFLFAPAVTPSVAVTGSAQRFPVHRIYCVGRNYAVHARQIRSDPPVFFIKPADALVAGGAAVPYPPRTVALQPEIELVIAIGRDGQDIQERAALEHVFGYAAGIDLTRRDLQRAARQSGQPWSAAKAFDHSAPVAAIRPAAQGHVTQGRIWLAVNGELRQESDVKHMLWGVPNIIAELSTYYELRPGDLIFCGTPAGVVPVKPGDELEGGIEGLEVLRIRIAPPRRSA
ncbi:MAG TPA: fumarylacetoacetate hydrolase family protein [Steroidobacteraceae bacterium]|jgi:fumarylpyruvate hydrolase|nr:fumarylacetoacetate hydrolase family protein [Steroidobacteraceae bacterium]